MTSRPSYGHTSWFKASASALSTACGREVAHWTFQTDADPKLWSSWAKHFRSHYIDDQMIDALKKGTEHQDSRAEYLRSMVFPDDVLKPGPSIRSGDFCEILVADMLVDLFGYVVPRTRFDHKSARNESPKGSDVIGMKFVDAGSHSPHDELAVYEVKGKISGKLSADKCRLQDAIDDSCKDYKRLGESLNAMKRRLIELGKLQERELVQRFQNMHDKPYKYQPGAAAVVTSTCWSPAQLRVTSCLHHPNSSSLKLLVIEATDFKSVSSELYRLAADEA